MPFNPIANSTFLDAFGANLSTTAQYLSVAAGSTKSLVELFQYPGSTVTVSAAPSSSTITIGLVLDRAADPTALLAGNWAQRQAALEAFPNAQALWATYGARDSSFDAVKAGISGVVGDLPLQNATEIGYISSAADRTIWLNLNPAQFQALFGQSLQLITSTSAPQRTPTDPTAQPVISTSFAWTGALGLDSSIPAGAIKGLWVEQQVAIANPKVLDSTLVPVPVGPLGIGNGVNTTGDTGHVIATPAAIAANYKFPLRPEVATAPIALVETDISNQFQLFSAYNMYRQQMGLPPATPAQFQVLSGTDNFTGSVIDEVTLDISVVAGAVPQSTQLIYSDFSKNGGTAFTAYQQAFFDSFHHPAVLSSSYPVTNQPTADSPFQWAWQQLFVDGALANVSVHMAGGDQGSSANIPNGAANALNTHSSPFTLIVGGTSIAGLYSARNDTTLTQLTALARQDDPGTVYQLVAAGLRTLPSNLSAAEPTPDGQATTLEKLFETVWQGLSMEPTTALNGQPVLGSDFGANQTGSGGVASTAIPSYQRDYGLSALTGGHRGTPDVAAIATGDTGYAALDSDFVNGTGSSLVHGDGGTSSAAPLWASLTTQFNAIFKDQGLPNLGYYNDLLYNAAVIAPGAFNDVQLGNNINSFFTPDTTTVYYNTNSPLLYMTPTGQGHSATPGYDLVSGLGTPNGTLLARALTWIAHDQISFTAIPDVIAPYGNGWVSGANQSLLIQTAAPVTIGVGLNVGGVATSFTSQASGAYPWTSRMAQQSLQKDFDAGLAILFDKQAQGTVTQLQAGIGQSLSVSIDSVAAEATQASFSSSFGFADFFAGDTSVRVARPLTVAETVGARNDQEAVVRVRQVDTDKLALTFYKVDDFTGSIGNLHPGDAGYQGAVQARAYQLGSGGTLLDGPGHGEYAQTTLQHVNAGDLIAMQLTNKTSGAVFSAFSQANETVNGQNVTHLWSYGANTFGWEGGNDRDFNDLIVQIDPSSAYNHAWIA